MSFSVGYICIHSCAKHNAGKRLLFFGMIIAIMLVLFIINLDINLYMPLQTQQNPTSSEDFADFSATWLDLAA